MSAPESVTAGGHPWRGWPSGRRTLLDMLDHVVRERPDTRLLNTPTMRLTARELHDLAARVAGLLAGRGVTSGDRVMIVSPNRDEIVGLLFGTAWLGAVVVPVNPALRGDPLTHQVRLARPAVIIADHTTVAAVERSVVDATPTGEPAPRILVADGPAFDEDRGDGHAHPHDAYRLPETGGPDRAPLDPAAVSAVLYTSGTTGPAKGVTIPHGQWFWWAVVATEQLELRGDDVLYTCLPLFHTNAITTVLQAMACGGRAVLGPRFSSSRFWSRLSESDATVTYILGAMASMLWQRRPDRLPPNLPRLILGPGIPGDLKPDFEKTFRCRVVEGFGMTEIGVPIYTPVGAPSVGTMGELHPDYEARIVDPSDEDVPDGTPGELVVRSRRPYAIFSGYWRDPDATVASWRNLWFHTGDIVRKDDRGRFWFVDRLKDSIRRRGENISSHDIEAAFLRLPGVEHCAAVAVPSELGEDEVLVCLVVGEDAPAPATLVAGAASHLPEFALPRFVRFVDALPMTANGKVSKQSLRADGVTADTWDRSPSGVPR